VLIVDDHAAFRASASALLKAEGFEVVGEAADGAGALRAVAVLRPEIVLLDIHLPASSPSWPSSAPDELSGTNVYLRSCRSASVATCGS
jgi:DNA-binding NarL/FixJ family response regulator